MDLIAFSLHLPYLFLYKTALPRCNLEYLEYIRGVNKSLLFFFFLNYNHTSEKEQEIIINIVL